MTLLDNINNFFFSESPIINPLTGNVVGSKKMLNKSDLTPFGLDSIIIEEDKCIIEITGKMIYNIGYNLIDINTIKPALKKLNDIDIIKFDINKVLVNSRVLKLDCTSDLKLRNIDECINEIVNYHMNDKFIITKQKNGIQFIKNVKTKRLRERIQFYKKGEKLRMETNIYRFEWLRNNFKTQNLKEILEYPHNVNKKMFEKIFNPRDIIHSKNDVDFNALLKKSKESNIREFEKECLVKLLLSKCGNDIKKISELYKNLIPNNNKRCNRLKKYRQCQKPKKINAKLLFENIEDLRKCLDEEFESNLAICID